MSAVRTVILSDMRRRRLQTVVIAVVILLSSGAATLALSLLVESDAPYEHAFAQANGAHLILTYAANRVTPAQLHRTASARGVTATAGPWPQTADIYTAPIANGGMQGQELFIVGRPGPNTPVDRLTMESGRWARAPGEVVISRALADNWEVGVGDVLSPGPGTQLPTLKIVGVAGSISPYTDAWVIPAEIPRLVTPRVPLEDQMLYRVSPSSTAADLRHATQSIAAGLPPGAVVNTNTYLDAKRNADTLSSVMVPFLLAFSVFALLASAMIITNVVSGVVIAGYRDIGILKAVGFTPGGVMGALLGLILLPALAGCLIGIPLGTAASQPFLQQTAHALNLPAPFTAAVPVDLLVLATVLGVAALAAAGPTWRAGRLSAVSAITTGTAPATGRGSRVEAAVSGLPVPRTLTLGLGDLLTRPLRSIMTLGAILFGVITVVFALSLHLSLGQVAAHLIRDRYVQVQVDRPPTGPGGPAVKPGFPGGAPPQISDRQVVSLLRSDPDTARFVAEGQEKIRVPGIAEPIDYYGYRGDSSWIGYALISGRWFTRPGEVVAPTKLLTETHLHVGQAFIAHVAGRPVHLRLVGEILDQTDDDLLLRGGWTLLHRADPRAQVYTYEVQVRPGVSPEAYSYALYRRMAPTGPNPLSIDTVERSSTDTDFILLNSVIAALALVLTAIAVAGVFNTVVLTTREKARDVAILKAVGMTPAGVVALVVAAVASLGVVAGALGIPGGLLVHARILTFMAHAADGSDIPPAFFDLIGHALLPLLALAGVAIAVIGAWLPARWAAAAPVAEVLQSE